MATSSDNLRTYPECYSLTNMAAHVGRTFGPGAPQLIDQGRIQMFADATGDQQWLHTDVERAKRESPFGGPIAHGYLTLSLIAAEQIAIGIYPSDASGIMNYGINKVRFLAPVPAGATVTLSATLLEVTEKSEGRWLLRVSNTINLTDSGKPAVIAETLGMVFA
ncbi:MaoC family dehydratase [Actibacterium sp.]|uniref:MaoC family dehydratase n=1 Tax=Actibacterium sp. TaxID=1872125 RepID=UPI0035663D08